VQSMRSGGSMPIECGVCGASWSHPTHSDQFRCASTIARACIVCVDCGYMLGSGGGVCTAHAEYAVGGGSVHVRCCVSGAS